MAQTSRRISIESGSLRVGGIVSSIIQFLEDSSFDPETTRVMSQAFDAACRELNDGGQPLIVREVLAQRIIQAAKEGERNPVRLREIALAAFAASRGQD
jgi:hypothetical protein